MINIYKSIEHKLCEIEEPVVGSWLNVVHPTQAEVARLIELGVPQDYITYSLDIDERARTEREDGVLLILLRVSYFEGGMADIPYLTVPLSIILTDHNIITSCNSSTAIDVAFLLLERLTSKEQSNLIREMMGFDVK